MSTDPRFWKPFLDSASRCVHVGAFDYWIARAEAAGAPTRAVVDAVLAWCRKTEEAAS